METLKSGERLLSLRLNSGTVGNISEAAPEQLAYWQSSRQDYKYRLSYQRAQLRYPT